MAHDFIDALLGAERPVIAEIKRRDSHGRDLFAGRGPADIVSAYEQAGAPCLSVVTGSWFGGSEALLAETAELTRLPLLQKDFVTRRDQITRAADLGAAAVLITAELLPRPALQSLVASCLDTGLTPFVEVTEQPQAAAVPHAEQCVIAVNNKNIRTRERDAGDTGRSLTLLPALLEAGTRCPVSASAVPDPHVGARLLDAGFAGLLVGTALLRDGDPRGWLDTVARRRQVPPAQPPAGTEVADAPAPLGGRP
ncbi:beta/alpha barrel domain-containing protein [Streptomonospora litoralis]|uniref:indole-3-glycerol-phosphate synthase n=1 Tax=Streptomonospora litoralis TaxID=2498135 RepID=A0A4P6Q6C1_9ACTN|nr:indole-3-glycerol-phosphate synthase [Streptomonospora litoralis]QBI54931.1 Indole-3-glycerol phosphate synthase [Streptomonospora litoralis]